MRFFISEKTGFSCKDRLITICDTKGNYFFIAENPYRDFSFNLPEGEYTTNNKLEKISPVNYPKKNLPKPNFKKRLPDSFEIFFTENPNKCSVDTSTNPGLIYFDYSFKNLPEYFLTYVKFHELGHYLYSGQKNKSEINCDHFAYNKMIELGYNPEQIKQAVNSILSNRPDARVRKKFINNLS